MADIQFKTQLREVKGVEEDLANFIEDFCDFLDGLEASNS